MSGRTLIEVVQLSAGYLTTHGSDSPRLDAEVLAGHALGLQRIDLYLQFDRPLDDAELESVRALVRRRAAGEPVAYITGHREFYGRDFVVSAAVLIPRPDTEALIELVLARFPDRTLPLRVLDMGTGSGCIALTLAAEFPGATAVATDISNDALAVAADNAERLGVAGRVTLRQGSWGEPIADKEVFDVICSNPPYVLDDELPGLMRDVRDHEPHVALVDAADGLGAYRQVITVATTHMPHSGVLALEVDPRRAAAVADLVRAALPGREVGVHRDLAGHERVVIAEATAS